VTLFASWHSREAPAVEPAPSWLQQRPRDRRSREAGSRTYEFGIRAGVDLAGRWLGGISIRVNALSILTHILPGNLVLTAATLSYPRNRDTPIEAQLTMAYRSSATVELAFNFATREHHGGISSSRHRRRDPPSRMGGAKLYILGTLSHCPPSAEYARLYARFAS